MELIEVFSLLVTLVVVLFSWLYVDIQTVEYCEDGNPHDYEFIRRLSGRTGDLGFGIRSYWETDDFKCKKCGREKTVWND